MDAGYSQISDEVHDLLCLIRHPVEISRGDLDLEAKKKEKKKNQVQGWEPLVANGYFQMIMDSFLYEL